MTNRTHLSIASALVTAGLLVAAGNAQALEAEISGHVNRAVMFADDGERNEIFFVDGEPSNTRFRFVGSEEILPGIEAGIKWEMEFVSQNSSRVSIDNRDADGDFDLNERHQDIYFQGAFGKFSIGQGDGAGNGISEIDLSGTSIAQYSGAGDNGGSLVFADDGNPIGVTVNDSYDQFDFESRYDRVRYDTPALGPVVLSTSYGNKGENDVYEFAATADTEVPGLGKFAAGLAYSNLGEEGTNNEEERETIGGSVSFLSDLGPNLTVVYTTREDDGLDADTIYVKGGYKMGQHAVSVDYGRTSFDESSANVDKGQFYGAAYVFKPVGWAELYAAVKIHTVDLETGSDPDDITIGLVGSRIKF